MPTPTSDGVLTAIPYAGSVDWYRKIAKENILYVDRDAPIGSLRSINRCRILGANGPLTLSIPLVHETAYAAAPYGAVKISDHGNWESKHWGAIFSAYGRAPYFEYLADDLKEIFLNRTTDSLADFNLQIFKYAQKILSLEITVTDTPENKYLCKKLLHFNDIDDFFCKNLEKHDRITTENTDNQPNRYYQVWSQKFGFTPHLSILDLIFNEGPSGILYLL